MEAVRFERPVWTVYRFGLDADGRLDDAIDMGSWWTLSDADAECQRLASLNDDPDYFYEVVEGTASGVYSADEAPPWIEDPERLRRLGHEIDR